MCRCVGILLPSNFFIGVLASENGTRIIYLGRYHEVMSVLYRGGEVSSSCVDMFVVFPPFRSARSSLPFLPGEIISLC